MPLKFTGANQPSPEDNSRANHPAGRGRPSSSAIDDLRKMLGQPSKDGRAKALPEGDVNDIISSISKLGQEEIELIKSTHERMDELVSAWHDVRDDPSSKAKLVTFVNLVRDTAENFPRMAVGSIISAGIAAIAELERRSNGQEE